MKMLLSVKRIYCLVSIAIFFLSANITLGQTLTSDHDDYPPGSTATLTGSGFQPGEDVEMIVHHAEATPDTGADHDSWIVVADLEGNFVTTWHVCEDDCEGALLEASADGQSSGLHAEVFFTDAACVAPIITSQPVGGTRHVGESITFSVTATPNGGGVLTFQWKKGGVNIPGASNVGGTTSTYTITQVTSSDAGSYTVGITRAGCVTAANSSPLVILTVKNTGGGAVSDDQTICSGEIPASLSSTISGTGDGTITYQWQKSIDISAWTSINGATNESYNPSALTNTSYFRRITISTLSGVPDSAYSNVISIFVHPTYNTTLTPVISCASYTLPWGAVATATGDYNHAYTTINGCDSMVTIHVTVNPVFNTTDAATACVSYTLPWGAIAIASSDYNHTYATINGCDSTVTIHVTINPSYNITGSPVTACVNYTLPWGVVAISSGDYTHSYSSVNGCDSTVTIHVTINPTFNIPGSPVTACVNYTLPWGVVATSSGDYSHSYSSMNGCDSIVTIHVTINLTYNITGSPVTACVNYTLPWGVVAISSGDYSHSYSSVNGCDSTVTIHVTINPTFNVTGSQVTACVNYTLPWGVVATSSGDYTHTYSSLNGCDSTVTIHVTINLTYNITGSPVTACVTYTLPWGIVATSSGDYSHNYSSVNGCDSAVTIHVAINPAYNITGSPVTACANYTLPWGVVATSSGDYSHSYSSVNGCDSMVTIYVTINLEPTATISIDSSVCEESTLYLSSDGGDTYSWSGPNGFTSTLQNPSISNVTSAATGTYSVTVTNAAGCSSTATSHVTVTQCGCQWCSKGAVLSYVFENLGNECNQPDIIVDLRLGTTTVDPQFVGTYLPATGSLQAAVNYMNADPSGDFNHDGSLFIGVIATDPENIPAACSSTSRPAAGDTPYGTENVTITNTHQSRLNIFGCSVTIWAANPNLPVITITNSAGAITVMDIHAKGSNIAGYLVQNTGDLVTVKNSRAMFNDIGYNVSGNSIEITGAPQISNNRIGILVSGSNNTLRTNSGIRANSEAGIKITGNNNESNGNETGVSNYPNATGIIVTGNTNNLHDDNAGYNTGKGIVVSGTGNVLEDEDANSNGGTGIEVTGSGNTLQGNEADMNGGNGILACGQTDNGSNTAQDNGIDPQVTFVCASPSNAKFSVVDISTDKAYRYDASFNLISSTSLTSNNSDANDLTDNGTNSYALDKSDKQVYRYVGTSAVSKTLKDASGSSLSSPTGLAISGNDMWVVDESKKQIYKYSLSAAFTGTGNINAIQAIAFTGTNANAGGLVIDATYLYVLDDADKQFYRYPRTGGTGVASKVMKDQGGSSLGNPSGAVMDGSFMWIVDNSKDKAYKYTLSVLYATGTSLNAEAQFTLYNLNLNATGIAVGTSSNLLKEDEAIIETLSVADMMKIYPNPNSGVFVIELNLGEGVNGTADIQIFNMIGQPVFTNTGDIIEGKLVQEVKFDQTLLSGSYFAHIISGDQIFTRQIIYQR